MGKIDIPYVEKDGILYPLLTIPADMELSAVGMLEFRGRKFVIGQGRMGKQETKTENENYYLMTLAAIAKELRERTEEKAVKVNLAVGVPLTLYGKEKKEFKNYLRANDKVSFYYEGVRYVVHFGKVRVFAQCHAAIANRMEGMERLTAVDCGSLGGEYEGVFSVHTDKEHLHGHLVYNSVNMVTGRKYSYKKGDWKNVIRPITNRLCEEYGLSIVAAEYSKDPVNMNRKQWEKEQSWGDFIMGDLQYCRNKAETFDEFVFLMEKLGYKVKVGAHISVKAEGMRRSKRLDTERRKEAKRECATINRCISESTLAHMEIPLDVDVENLYMVDVPEFKENEISYEEREDYDEVEVYKMDESDVDMEAYGTELASVDDMLPEVDVLEPEPVAAEVLREEADVISEQELDYGINESETVTKLYEPINESIEVVDEVYADLQNFATPDMTKEHYEALTDKEKVEWLGIADCSVQDAIQKFISKIDSIGIVYRYSDDMLDEFMKLESVVVQMKREQRVGKGERSR